MRNSTASLLLLLCSALPAFAGIDGGISGSVVDPQGVAVPQAIVRVLNSDGKVVEQTKTSETGDYSLRVRAGVYRVFAQAAGLAPSYNEVRVTSGADIINPIQLVKSDGQATGANAGEMLLEVKAKKKLVHNSASTSMTELDQEQIRQLPQGSEISLPKLITTTSPGVVQGPFGQMFFRGNHSNIQYQIDGVQLPDSPSNTFGQTFSPRNIDTMEVITGGFSSEYGMRLSSVVNIATKSGKETPGGEIELNYGSYDTISPHLLYGGSNESGNLHYFFSANYNRSSRGIDTPQPESQTKQTQGGSESIHNNNFGNSEFAKVDWQVDNQNKFSFVAFNSQSTLQIPNYPGSFAPTDAFFHDSDSFGNHNEEGGPTFNYVPATTNSTQFEQNTFAQVVWKRSFTEKSFLQVAPYYKYSQIVVNNDPVNELFTAPGGAHPVAGSTATSFAENRHVNNLGLKADYSLRMDDRNLVKTGFQLQGSRADGSFSVQRSLDNSVSTISDDSSTTSYFESVYLQDDFSIFKSLILNAGVRYDATQFHFAGVDASDSLFQPRVGLNYLPTDTTKFHVYYGKLFQPSTVENLRSTFNKLNTSATPYDIKAEKDDFYEAGVSQQLFGKQIFQLNVYYKDAVNMLDNAQLLNTSISQPYNLATGYAYGVELSLRGKLTDDWSEYVNYSYGIAKGKGISGGAWASDEPASTSYQYLDHLQIHTANAGLTYSKNYFWGTAQGVFGSGLRTGHEKEISLPSHFTMDTTIGYEFHGDSWLSKFRVSGDVLNVLDNRYPITIANGFNGSHYAAGRQYFIRIAKSL